MWCGMEWSGVGCDVIWDWDWDCGMEWRGCDGMWCSVVEDVMGLVFVFLLLSVFLSYYPHLMCTFLLPSFNAFSLLLSFFMCYYPHLMRSTVDGPCSPIQI